MDYKRLDDLMKDRQDGDSAYFSLRKQKENIVSTLKATHTIDLEYDIVKYVLKKKIKNTYTGAKRRTFYRKVDKKIPVIVDDTITTKKVGEYGAQLPILEERQVENPDDNNTRVRPIQSPIKKMDYKIIQVDEVIPSEPLHIDILLPYALRAVSYLEKNDPNYNATPLLQNFKIIVEAIHEIQSFIGEKISIRLSFSNAAKNNTEMGLNKQEKEEWEANVSERLQKYCAHYDVDIKRIVPSQKGGIKNWNMMFGFGFEGCAYTLTQSKAAGNYSRERSVLTNILGKSLDYMGINKSSQNMNILLGQPLHDTERCAFEELKSYLDKIFILKPQRQYD